MVSDGNARRFVAAAVVRSALAITWHNLFRFLGIVVAVAIPVALLTALARLVLLSGVTPGPNGTIDVGSNGAVVVFLVVAALLTLLAFLLTQAAITAATLQALRGGTVGIGASLSRALAALPRLIPAGMLLFLGGGALAGIIGYFIVRIFGGATPGAAMDAGAAQDARTALGLFSLAVIVVAFTILTLVWVFVPAIMAERAGPIASFKRSFALTKGNRWRIAGIVVLLSMANLLASVLTRFLMANGAPLGGFALSIIAGLFFLVLGAVLSAVGYAHLRAEKEGITAADLRAFD
jgi:hypothetical protein